MNIFTNGVFDLFHYGHENFLWRAKNNPNDFLIVGVTSDESNAKYKRTSLQTWENRARRVSLHRNVDLVIKTDWSKDLGTYFYEKFQIQKQVQGDDSSSFDVAKSINIFECIGRENNISTSDLLNILDEQVQTVKEKKSMNEITLVGSDLDSLFIKKESAQTLRGIGDIYIPKSRSLNEELILYEIKRIYPKGIEIPGISKFKLVDFTQPVCRLNDQTLILKRELDTLTLVELDVDDIDLNEYARACMFALSLIHTIPIEQGRKVFGAIREDGLNRIKIQIQISFCLKDTKIGWLARKFVEDRRTCKENSVVLHGDFAPKNILINEKQLTIIDFEECGIGDAALDIGYFFAELFLHCLNIQQPNLFVDLNFNNVFSSYSNPKTFDFELNEAIVKWFSLFVASRVSGIIETSSQNYKNYHEIMELATTLFSDCTNLEEARLLIKNKYCN